MRKIYVFCWRVVASCLWNVMFWNARYRRMDFLSWDGCLKLLAGTWIWNWSLVSLCTLVGSCLVLFCRCAVSLFGSKREQLCSLLCLVWIWLSFVHEAVNSLGSKYQPTLCRLNISLTRYLGCVILPETHWSNVMLERDREEACHSLSSVLTRWQLRSNINSVWPMSVSPLSDQLMCSNILF